MQITPNFLPRKKSDDFSSGAVSTLRLKAGFFLVRQPCLKAEFLYTNGKFTEAFFFLKKDVEQLPQHLLYSDCREQIS